MNLFEKHKIISEMETSILAHNLSEKVQAGSIICFNGNLGSGKTTFIRYFCEAFHIKNVTSPSFSIVNEYYGSLRIYHFDFYRLNDVSELYDIGIEDYLNEEKAIIVIEWANMFKEILPKRRIEVNISLFENEEREIIIKSYE